jgi:uncharacterized protein YcfJ
MFGHKRTQRLATLAVAGSLFLPPAVVAGHRHGYRADRPIEYARVIDVEPLVRNVTIEVPVRECVETEAWEPGPSHYQQPYAGGHPRSTVVPTVAGGVIGGVIGDRFGGGEGRDAMRLLGALVGAAIGHDAGQRRQYQYAAAPYAVASPGRAYPVTECLTRYEPRTEQRVDGYRVTYEYHGREYVTHTTEEPGQRIPVEVDVRPAW